jgi:AraC-like DNA-binding protein
MSQTGMPATTGPQIVVRDQVQVLVTGCGSVILGADWCYPDLCAPFWRLYLDHDAGAAIAIGRERIPIVAGEPLLVPPWLHWRAVPGAGVRHDFIQFLVPGLGDALIRRAFPRPVALPGADLAATVSAACAGLAGGLAARDLLLATAAAALALGRAVAALPPLPAALVDEQLTRPHPVRTLAAAIAADPGADWSVAAIAARLGCSPDHATRLFRRQLGDTPARVVVERRLAAAARLLGDGPDPIEAIAEACGFADRFSFSRAFARRFGSGPAAWRRWVRR